jgi:uncharacterized membrane protein YhfC
MLTFSIILTLLILFIVPAVTVFYLVRRFHISWQVLLIGAFTLVAAQFLQQFALGGLNELLGSEAMTLLATPSGLLLAAVLVGLAVAIVDVAVRWVAYKLLKTSADSFGFALAFGASHAATDMIVFIGVPMLINFVTIFYVLSNGVNVLELGAEDAARVSQQVADFLATPPDFYIASGLERVFALVFSIAISVIVWLSIKQSKFLLTLVAVVWYAFFQTIETVAYYAGMPVWGIVLLSAFFAAVNLWFLYKVYRNTPGAPPLFWGRLKPIGYIEQ